MCVCERVKSSNTKPGKPQRKCENIRIRLSKIDLSTFLFCYCCSLFQNHFLTRKLELLRSEINFRNKSFNQILFFFLRVWGFSPEFFIYIYIYNI